MDQLKDFFDQHFSMESFGHFSFRNAIIFFGVLIIGRILFVFFRRIVLRGFFKRKKVDRGRQYSLTSLIAYFYYTLLFFMALQMAGINLSILLTAGAALMVGVGIGLQNMFSDLISGIILLFEGSIEKGDWVEIGETEGVVEKIGLRTSLIETRSGVSIIVPNSALTSEKVVNLSHHKDRIRYSVTIGVSYKIEPKLVYEVLLKITSEGEQILQEPQPIVRLINFGDSSIDYEILFWSTEYRGIADVKSKIRFAMGEAFKENNIEIPFPQRDLHLKIEQLQEMKSQFEIKPKEK